MDNVTHWSQGARNWGAGDITGGGQERDVTDVGSVHSEYITYDAFIHFEDVSIHVEDTTDETSIHSIDTPDDLYIHWGEITGEIHRNMSGGHQGEGSENSTLLILAVTN